MFFATAAVTLATLTSVTHAPTTAVTMSPASVATTSNVAHSTYRVFNTGSVTEKMRIQAVNLKPLKDHPGSWAVFDEAEHYRVSDEAFTLKAKAHRDVIVTIYAPSDQFRHDYGVSVQALPGTDNGKGAASISASAVARFTVRPLAAPAPNQAPVSVGEAEKPSGTPTWTIAAIGGLVLALVAGTMRVLNIKRRKARANAL